GLDSGIPQTAPGKIAVTLVLIVSVGVVATFTGSIASFLVERRLGGRRIMPGHELKNHIVICNWNEKGVPIIGELHAEIVKDKRPIVVISEGADAADLPDEADLPEFEDVYLVKGDPANEVILKRANVHHAYSVVVLADPEEGELADAKSILIAMAVRSVCQAAGAEKTHICVEGIAPQNVAHLRRAGADEIVSASDFSMMLLAQSTLAHGLSTVYRDLLTVSGETNEIYILPVPDEFVGKSFADLGTAMLANADAENPTILIGVATEDGIHVNPPPGEFERFSEGDKAVVIAFERPDHLV
ncbi:MAG: TrkA-related ion transporter, partial [Planctomycetota bacterium]